jgi:hypothetical protein
MRDTLPLPHSIRRWFATTKVVAERDKARVPSERINNAGERGIE